MIIEDFKELEKVATLWHANTGKLSRTIYLHIKFTGDLLLLIDKYNNKLLLNGALEKLKSKINLNDSFIVEISEHWVLNSKNEYYIMRVLRDVVYNTVKKEWIAETNASLHRR